MSATDLLPPRPLKARDIPLTSHTNPLSGSYLPLLPTDAASALATLIECHNALIPGSNTTGTVRVAADLSLDQLLDTIKQKLLLVHVVPALQLVAHILDAMLGELESAKNGSTGASSKSLKSVELLFSQAQAHPANIDLDQYLNQYAVQLWNILLPASPVPEVLIQIVFTPILKYNVELLSQPWILESIIIEVSNLPGLKQDVKTKLWKILTLFKKNGPNDRNTSFRDLIYRFGSRSTVFRVLKLTWSPVEYCVPIIVNRVVSNGINELAKMDREITHELLTALNKILVNGATIPSTQKQQEIRAEALSKVPKVFGTPIIPDDTFDSGVVNQRLIVSLLDLSLEILRAI